VAQDDGIALALGSRTTVVQAEISAIKAHVMENVEEGYRRRTSTFFPTVKQPLRLNNSLLNFKLIWDCHQSLVKLAEHKRIQQVQVLGHVGIDRKKIARLGSSLPFTLSLPLGIPTNIARGMIRPSAKRAGELLCMSRNQLRIMMGLLTGHCQLKEYLLKLGLAGITGCERSRLLKQPHMFFVMVRHWQYED
jgi:hypothetical protein